MWITSGEKTTIVSPIQEITHSRDEGDYMVKYSTLLQVMPERVQNYYNTNWHTIRDEWVEGLKSRSMNLGTQTNNRIESFFSHLKRLVILRGSLKELFDRFMGTLTTLRTKRSHRLLTSLSKQPVKEILEEQRQY